MSNEIGTTAEVAVMTRHLADKVGKKVAGPYADQVTQGLDAIVDDFRATGDDQADARSLSEALATAFDTLDLGALEEGLAQAMFQAAGIGVASGPSLGRASNAD